MNAVTDPIGNLLRRQYEMAGKSVVVTGGGGGIGRATALLFASLGARVTILERNPDSAGETVRLSADLGGTIQSHIVDLGQEAEIVGAFDAIIRTHNSVDVLVNNAALNIAGASVDMASSHWKSVIDVNLSAVFFASRCAARSMIANGGGCIVNVASVGGLSAGITGRGNANASYRAAKGGVVNLTRALAVEWAGQNVRVNAVAPGYVRTPMVQRLTDDPVRLKATEERVPLGRLAEPEEIAWPIAFLASRAASMITGQTLVIDGGLLA